MKKFLFHTTMLVLVLNVMMALTGFRLNYEQAIVQPGQHYMAGPFGDLAAQKTPSIACRFWTGLGTSITVWRYGTEGDAKSKCPVWMW